MINDNQNIECYEIKYSTSKFEPHNQYVKLIIQTSEGISVWFKNH